MRMLYFRKKITEIEINIVSLWQKLKEILLCLLNLL